MLLTMPTTKQDNRTLIIGATALGVVVALNLVFLLLSSSYFESHKEVVGGALVPSYTPDQMMKVRVSFAVCSIIVTAAGAFASLRPRQVGHLLAGLFGAVYVIAVIRGLVAGGMPGVLAATWLVAGSLLIALTWQSYFHRSRASWSVIVAICGVFAVCELFGAPKIAAALDISLWLAMILPGLKVVATVALVALRDDYADVGGVGDRLSA
jgi:hypothetical protein